MEPTCSAGCPMVIAYEDIRAERDQLQEDLDAAKRFMLASIERAEKRVWGEDKPKRKVRKQGGIR